jgi:hypothetical protein
VGAAGLTTMPFEFDFQGGFFRLQDFLARLDRFTNVRGEDINVRGRLLTVDGFELAAADPSFSSMTAKVRATAYLLPGDEGLLAGATPAGPATATSSPVPAAGAAGSTPTPASAATGG